MDKITILTECLYNPKFYKAYLYGVSPLFELTLLKRKMNGLKDLSFQKIKVCDFLKKK